MAEARARCCGSAASCNRVGARHAAAASYVALVIARIVLAVSLVLLVAAPAAWAAGAAAPAPIELVDDGAPLADDAAVAPCAPVLAAAARAAAVRPPPFEEIALPRPAPARIFRPPRA